MNVVEGLVVNHLKDILIQIARDNEEKVLAELKARLDAIDLPIVDGQSEEMVKADIETYAKKGYDELLKLL